MHGRPGADFEIGMRLACHPPCRPGCWDHQIEVLPLALIELSRSVGLESTLNSSMPAKSSSHCETDHTLVIGVDLGSGGSSGRWTSRPLFAGGNLPTLGPDDVAWANVGDSEKNLYEIGLD